MTVLVSWTTATGRALLVAAVVVVTWESAQAFAPPSLFVAPNSVALASHPLPSRARVVHRHSLIDPTTQCRLSDATTSTITGRRHLPLLSNGGNSDGIDTAKTTASSSMTAMTRTKIMAIALSCLQKLRHLFRQRRMIATALALAVVGWMNGASFSGARLEPAHAGTASPPLASRLFRTGSSIQPLYSFPGSNARGGGGSGTTTATSTAASSAKGKSSTVAPTPKNKRGEKGVVVTTIQKKRPKATSAKTPIAATSTSISSRLRIITGSGVVLTTLAVGAAKLQTKQQRADTDTNAEQMENDAFLQAELDSVRQATRQEAQAQAEADRILANLQKESAIMDSLVAGERELQSTLEALNSASSLSTTAPTVAKAATQGDAAVVTDAAAATTTTTTTTTIVADPPAVLNVETITMPRAEASVMAAATDTDTVSPISMDTTEPLSTDAALSSNAVATTLTSAPKDETTPNALPKVLQTLLQNAATKYNEPVTVDAAAATNTGPPATSDMVEGVLVPFFADKTVVEESSPSPPPAGLAGTSIADASSPTLKSGTTTSSTLSAAKDKISQFFFSSLKRDDSASSTLSGSTTTAFAGSAAMSNELNKPTRSTSTAMSKRIKPSAALNKAREQPKPASEEARLQAKYAAIASLEERAFTILVDLGMVTLHDDVFPTLLPTTTTPSAMPTPSVEESEWA